MGIAKDHPPARRVAALGRWLTGGTPGSRHRDVQGGTQRATVLGAGDGLLTNLSLVLGVAGASTNASAVRLAGVAGLLAGAFSMAAGELVSGRAQQERLELGGAPQAPGSAWQAAIMSFLSFSVGAILPLFPWFFSAGSSAVIASVIIGGVAALALGAAIGFMSGRSVLSTALRQLAVAAIAAAVTYGVGSLLGVSTT